MGSLEHATAVCPVEACVLPRNSNMMMILFVGSGVGCCGSLVLYIHYLWVYHCSSVGS